MQRKKIMRKTKWLGTFVAAMCIGLTGGFMDFLTPSINMEPDLLVPQQREVDSAMPVSGKVSPPAVSADGAILMDSGTGEILYEKDADKRCYPASTTKIMTALVVLDILEELSLDLSAEVIVPAEAAGIEGSSMYLKKDEKLTLEELLYGLMLQSGNDGATCLALTCGGSMERFVDLMNTKAAALGCTDTHFTNPHGLHDEDHYTTARDLAVIAAATMEKEDFRRIAGTKEWSSLSSGRHFQNKNKTVHQYEGATGVKIGFTKAAGRTLAASAKRGDTELIAVVLNDSNWFGDAYDLLDYGFALKGE